MIVRLLSCRRAAQSLVEFGLIVAALGILGVAGLQVLGRAEENYFIPLGNSLAPQAPSGTDDVVHPTRVTISCTPATVLVLLSTTCTLSSSDAWTTKRTWPRGTIQLFVNGAAGSTCTLAQDTTSADPALGSCALQWSPTVANVPSATLSAHYVPTDGTHAPPASDPYQIVQVRQQVNVAFTPPAGQSTACWNPAIVVPGQPEAVEIGHPILCHLTITDPLGHPVAGTPVQVTEATSAPGGSPFFSCFTNNNRSLYAQCSPASAAFAGNTDSSGQLTFVYRRYYDALAATVTDTFTATATAYSSSIGTHPISIVPPLAGAHPTDMVVDCESDVDNSSSWVAASGLSVRSDTALKGSNGDAVVCTIVVFDVDPTNVYISGNLDTEDAYAPAGWVYWLDERGQPVLDRNSQAIVCQLTRGNPLGAPDLPYQINGLPDYASACSVTLWPTGDHTFTAHYDGEPPPNPAHKPVIGRQISIDFD